MLNQIVHLNHIYFDLPLPAIMRRLGGKISDNQQLAMVEKPSRLIYDNCKAQAFYGHLDINCNDGKSVELSDGTQILSDSVAGFLEGASQCWLAVATIGEKPLDMVKQALAENNGSRALILDGAASECVEAVIEAVQRQAAREYLRYGMVLDHRRFSCGFGGWELSGQRNFFQWFPLETIGLKLSESFIVTPEKTITAIAGLRKRN